MVTGTDDVYAHRADRAVVLCVTQSSNSASLQLSRSRRGREVLVAIPCGDYSDRDPACHGDFVLSDVQYPTLWLPVGLTAAVVVGAAVWPGDRFTRVVVALCLIALVIVGYFLLPSVFDVDQLIRG
jgi:hypothetical protein